MTTQRLNFSTAARDGGSAGLAGLPLSARGVPPEADPMGRPGEAWPFLDQLARVTQMFVGHPDVLPVCRRILSEGTGREAFVARSWRAGEGRALFGPLRCQYVETGLFDDLGRHVAPRRTMHRLRGVWGFVLDDVGTAKAPRRPLLRPTYVVETSPGSQQWGYAFPRPCRDIRFIKALATGLQHSGLTDPSACGVHRLVRLPGSKPVGKPHRARLVEWSGRTYAPEDLPDLLGFEPGRVRRGTEGDGRTVPFDAERIADPIWDALAENGLVEEAPNEEGWAPVVCPRHHEHSDPTRIWARYRPRTMDAPAGFRCFHSHGDRYGLAAFARDVRALDTAPFHEKAPAVVGTDRGDFSANKEARRGAS